ncbi:unnamed protein product [Parnassius apollo]|uniref:(apollo) hypothetical protein n=1 Tax=Parnassius apollo TaxID=110799 RepID=A0A8S3XLD0_PARAO|nr:unnamed protein product [Parnassius apollo]
MAKNLRNKTIVITGGATGLGYAIADKFLNKEAKVVILLDIDEEKVAEAVKTLVTKYGDKRAVFYTCDITKDLDAVYEKIISNFKTIDVLVNNAGILNDFNVRKTMEINVIALLDWSFKFWEHMRTDKSGKGGTIINLSSIYGFQFDQYMPVYQASKSAVMAFTKSLGHSYNFARFGVRVIAICPGFTKTSLVIDMKTRVPEVQEDFLKFTEQQLWQEADSVGEAAVDVFETAESGTAWMIVGAKPISQVV